MLAPKLALRLPAQASRRNKQYTASVTSVSAPKHPIWHTSGDVESPSGRPTPWTTWTRQRSQHGRPAMPSTACRSLAIEPVPSDLRIEAKEEDGTTDLEYDEENKVVRIPLSALGPEGRRRTKLVLFTCNKCGTRTARLVNPIAWENGVVFGQCGGCEVWHVLSAPNKKIFEEIRYKDVQEPAGADPGTGGPTVQAGPAQPEAQ